MSQTRVALFVLITFGIIALIFEGFSFLILKIKLGDFDLSIQGNGTMVESSYQVWEHPANYTTWSGKTHFNNLAFRRLEDTSIEKPPGVKRIFIMGGSAAFGSQALPGSIYIGLSAQGEYTLEETIAGQLETLLNEKYPNQQFEVINAAVNWSRLHQQTLHYLRKLRSLEPDLILSMDAQNDSSPIDKHLNQWTWSQAAFGADLQSNLKYKLRPIFRNSYTAYLFAMVLFRSPSAYEVDQEAVTKYSAIQSPQDLEQRLTRYAVKHEASLKKATDE
ncbi:MAG: hypothetical protein AAF391_12410, partial [Bacteroidota bacterium]